MRSIFLEHALRNVPRLLSLMDRNPASKTYGCFDRTFWHYKKSDMPISSLQSGVYSMALLYSYKLSNNPYHENKRVLSWILAGINYWCRLCNKNGSFNDYYPNEQSYIATSLGLLPIARTLILMKDNIPKKNLAFAKKTMEKACEFLSSHSEKKVMNQEAASACAIFFANKLLKKKRYQKAYISKIKQILSRQNKEGWFPEYEGFDIGYLSFHIDFFSLLYDETKDKRLLFALFRAIDFISYFFHPDGTCGGEYSARSTEYIIPSGFLRISSKARLAERIYDFIEQSLIEDKGFSIDVLDFRYLPIYMHQYVESAIMEERHDKIINEKTRLPKLPFEKGDFEKEFPYAGAFVKKYRDHYIIIGTKKGGVIKVYSIGKRNLAYSDCGYVFPNPKNYLTTTYYDRDRRVNIFLLKKDTEGIRKIEIFGRLYLVSEIKPDPFKHIVLRIINSLPFLSRHLREIIKHRMITKKNIIPRRFYRRIEFYPKNIKVCDSLSIRRKGMRVAKFSFRYTPSAKYFNENELLMQDHEKAMPGKNVKTIELREWS